MPTPTDLREFGESQGIFWIPDKPEKKVQRDYAKRLRTGNQLVLKK